jgi:hypothetical protein
VAPGGGIIAGRVKNHKGGGEISKHALFLPRGLLKEDSKYLLLPDGNTCFPPFSFFRGNYKNESK